QGYKCCSDVNGTTYFTDSDGEWGIENNEWCFLHEKDNCYRRVGYKCCKSTTMNVYADEEGYWGVENGKWCYIK
ncbi:Non-catalytic module family DOC2, partial [Piromyces sp. E2]